MCKHAGARTSGLADGIVITPSHNPPADGGFKYNPPNGGPAEPEVTDWIGKKANEFLEAGLRGVARTLYDKALRASTTHRHDYLNAHVNEAVDPTFRFMTVDWDGQIRIDPSSPYAMQRLIELKDRFDLAFACDTDADRPGIVTRGHGLLPPNHYLAVAILCLFQHRPEWRPEAAACGRQTMVNSALASP